MSIPQRASSSSTGQDDHQEEFTSLGKKTSILDEPVPDDQGAQDGASSECYLIL
jgi:hypothetical protein